VSPRPRTVADVDILQGTNRVLSRMGPHAMTLADVSAEVGLAPATLIQRFGSRRQLLLALAEWAAASAAVPFERARAEHDSPLRTLVTALATSTPYMTTPEELAHHLAFLQSDLTDAQFYPVARRQFAAQLEEIRVLLDEALALREIGPTETAQLAVLVQAQFNGALLTWAIYREGALQDWVRLHMARFLEPLASRGFMDR
jgi:AcrR family transcriptional regulator